ncbi:MAG: AAA family ATPase [Candidatus Nanoarchaeia archaeon]|nr:AAA family ATPase [Candidatus Nanoarchaeia archaeon]
MKVIGLCGEIGGGKDAFADYLVRKRGYQKIVMSEVVTEELKKLKLPINREEMQKLSREYKSKYGNGVWAKACLEYARKQGMRRAVISGLRDIDEVKLFKRELGRDFILVYITAEQEIRYQRLIKRAGVKDPKTIAEIEAQEQKEREIFNLYNHFRDYADKIVSNNGLVVELFAAADLLLKETGFQSIEN